MERVTKFDKASVGFRVALETRWNESDQDHGRFNSHKVHDFLEGFDLVVLLVVNGPLKLSTVDLLLLGAVKANVYSWQASVARRDLNNLSSPFFEPAMMKSTQLATSRFQFVWSPELEILGGSKMPWCGFFSEHGPTT